MQKTSLTISKMDCPSEEQMIRMALADFATVKSLHFDIPNRHLVIYHTGDYHSIVERIDSLKLDTSLIDSVSSDSYSTPPQNQVSDRKLLWQVLILNFFFFILEFTTGYISSSIGLVADSFDMLADSIVYGLSLIAINRTLSHKKSVAKIAGYFQLLLAILGFSEVIRRFMGVEEVPAFLTMIVISILALICNGLCLYLLQKSTSKEAHIQASMIFTSNDVIINLGVIVSGVFVYLTDSRYPDLIVGTAVFFIVGQGALRILKLSQ